MKQKVDQARNLSYTMLLQVLENKAYSHITVQNYFSNSALDKRDRAFSLALFYGVLTRLYTLDFYLNKKIKKGVDSLDPPVRTILRIGVWQLLFARSVPSFAAVNETITLLRTYSNEGAVKLGNSVLRRISEEKENGLFSIETEKFDVKYALNRELSGIVKKCFGEEKAASIMEAFLEEPEVSIRVNTTKANQEEVLRYFLEEGISLQKGHLVEDAFLLPLEGRNPASFSAFSDGWISIQNEAAMLVAKLASPKKGDMVLDVCAAPGGKSCHIAELMGNEGQVFSLDIHDKRVEKIRENKERLGLTAITEMEADATALRKIMPERENSFDIVLADVPCSGLGLLKRRPDIKQTMTYEKIQGMLPLQQEILSESSFFVKPGGLLLYSTCTINVEENEKQADIFLMNHPDFVPVSLYDALFSAVGAHAARHKERAEKGQLLLLPDEDLCDGFFIAGFRRVYE